MVNEKKTRELRVEVTWVPVRDRHGRTRMQARWHAPLAATRTVAA